MSRCECGQPKDAKRRCCRACQEAARTTLPRRRILEAVAAHPDGATALDVLARLPPTTTAASVHQALHRAWRDGAVRRLRMGVYEVAP